MISITTGIITIITIMTPAPMTIITPPIIVGTQASILALAHL